MFKFKKIYFKFYHLLRFLGIFIFFFLFIPLTYAEEYNTCFDEYKIGTVTIGTYNSNYALLSTPEIPISSFDDTYYVRFFSQNPFDIPGSNNIFLSRNTLYVQPDNTTINGVLSTHSFDVSNQVFTLKPYKSYTNENSKGVLLQAAKTSSSNYTNLNGATVIVSTNLDDVLTCPTPPVPDNNVFSDFLTIYTDRISYLANGFTENPYLLAMVGIIFAWIVLELFLHIFHLKGGYKK